MLRTPLCQSGPSCGCSREVAGRLRRDSTGITGKSHYSFDVRIVQDAVYVVLLPPGNQLLDSIHYLSIRAGRTLHALFSLNLDV